MEKSAVDSPNSVAKNKTSAFVDFLTRLVKEKPLGLIGAVITLLLLLTGLFADFLAPYGMNELTGALRAAPSSRFLLGTDNLGRDLLSRIIYGARISVIVGLAGSLLVVFIGTVIGIVSGYVGGKFDLIVQRFVDAWMCFPGLILLMVLISIIGPGVWQVIIVLGISWGIVTSRLIRGATLSIKANSYVQAAVATGCSNTRIFARHILPNIVAPILIMFTTRVPVIILTEASLSFLGFGIPPPTPSWGGMLGGSARTFMFMAPWMVIWPGVALAATVYGTNIFGDAVRDLLDPRLRGGAGRFGAGIKLRKMDKGGEADQDDDGERSVDVRESPE
jgi:peptide/nickel transport system permease protein